MPSDGTVRIEIFFFILHFQRRPEDVIKQLKSIIFYADARLGMEERNLLSIAYKHITGTLRTSWRTVESIEKQETGNGRATLREQTLIRRQREKIELELADTCKDLLELLDRHLVPAAEAGEERVFYLKMHVPFPPFTFPPFLFS
jgi:14-3-3 protein epsilon